MAITIFCQSFLDIITRISYALSDIFTIWMGVIVTRFAPSVNSEELLSFSGIYPCVIAIIRHTLLSRYIWVSPIRANRASSIIIQYLNSVIARPPLDSHVLVFSLIILDSWLILSLYFEFTTRGSCA